METIRNLILQGVAICDINVKKGEDEVKLLEKEFGKDQAIFLKTDVSKDDELEGLLQILIYKLLCYAVLLYRYNFFS
jgi:hypothetical protein